VTDAYDAADNSAKCYDVAISAMRERLAACNKQTFLDGKVALYAGDCLEVLKLLPDKSIDSAVMDPPYHLTSIVKRFGSGSAAPAKSGKTGAYARASAGFMGKQWDGGDIAFRVELWVEVLRVLKPGGHLVAFSGTRTYHRMACAIEDAGFEIRDQIGWCYGAGFPKSHNVSRNIGDARCACEGQAGAASVLQHDLRSVRGADVSQAQRDAVERGQVLHDGVSQQGASSAVLRAEPEKGRSRRAKRGVEGWGDVQEAPRELCERPLCGVSAGTGVDGSPGRLRDGAPPSDGPMGGQATDADGMRASQGSRPAQQRAGELGTVALQSDAQAGGAWTPCGRCGKPIIPDGLGSALKPAWEPICLARKPMTGTLAQNVLEHGTGGLNIDGCRVETDPGDDIFAKNPHTHGGFGHADAQVYGAGKGSDYKPQNGRWPANLIHDGSEEVVGAFPESESGIAVTRNGGGRRIGGNGIYGGSAPHDGLPDSGYSDAGSAARFFYTAKADAEDRLGSKHPTVKPLDLMQWLVRLVTPKGGMVLDCFAGTGTTGEAAWREGMRACLIEREAEYQADIARRMDLAAKPTKRAAVAASKNNLERPEDLPLFGGATP
jgi:DNA modification methylase